MAKLISKRTFRIKVLLFTMTTSSLGYHFLMLNAAINVYSFHFIPCAYSLGSGSFTGTDIESDEDNTIINIGHGGVFIAGGHDDKYNNDGKTIPAVPPIGKSTNQRINLSDKKY